MHCYKLELQGFITGSSFSSSHLHEALLLTLLHSERLKLYGVLAILSAIGLNVQTVFAFLTNSKGLSLFRW